MKHLKIFENFRTLSIIAITLIYCIHICECVNKKSNLKNSNSESNCKDAEDIAVSRKKRALTFPPGSTIQLGM